MSATTTEAPTGIAPASPRRLVDIVLRARTFGILGVLVLFVLITTAIQPRFLNASNIQFILATTALYALVAIGETFVVITRNVDLSVGSVVGLSAYVSANMFQAAPRHPDPRRVPRRSRRRIGLRTRDGNHHRRRARAQASW